MKTKVFNDYIKLGQTGHFPLFFNEWIKDSLHINQAIKYKSALKNVDDIFKRLERHKTLDKKKTALMALPTKDRQIFISSFFKLVERTTLEHNSELH